MIIVFKYFDFFCKFIYKIKQNPILYLKRWKEPEQRWMKKMYERQTDAFNERMTDY